MNKKWDRNGYKVRNRYRARPNRYSVLYRRKKRRRRRFLVFVCSLSFTISGVLLFQRYSQQELDLPASGSVAIATAKQSQFKSSFISQRPNVLLFETQQANQFVMDVTPAADRMASLESEIGAFISNIDTPDTAASNPIEPEKILSELPDVVWSTSVVKSGDTLTAIFVRNYLSSKAAVQVSKLPGTKLIKVLKVGDEIRFARNSAHELLGIEFTRTNQKKKNSKRLIVLANENSFEVVNDEETERVGSLENLLTEKFSLVQELEEDVQLALNEHVNNSNHVWHDVKVKSGDSLSQIFRRINLTEKEAIEVAGTPRGRWLKSGLKVGQELQVVTSQQGEFVALELKDLEIAKTRVVVANQGDYLVGYRELETEVEEKAVCTTIRFNLYEAAKAVKLPHNLVDQFADIHDSRIDFSRQLRKGDEYCVVYEQEYVEGTAVKQPIILAASLHQHDNLIQVYRFENEFSANPYYDQYGINMQGYFLKSPIKYARVTSVFSNNRFHPILKRNRPHRGVDYGARTGTPIHATADGVVKKRRHERGYGKVIFLQHGSKYETVYAHMSKFASGTKPGSRVKQGQIIGYVGSTGLSTGPHLHYEFRVDGVHKDPLSFPLPQGKPIPDHLVEQYEQYVEVFSEKLYRANEPKFAKLQNENST